MPVFRKTSICALIAALGIAAAPLTSHADATARANTGTSADPGAPQNPLVHGTIDATSQASATTGGYANAYANLNTGILRDAGASDPLTGITTTTQASSSISDTLTFQSGSGLTAYIDYVFEGTLTAPQPANSSNAFAQLIITVSTPATSTTRYETLSAFAANCGSAATNCVVGTSTQRTGSVAFQIFNGPIVMTMSLNGNASNGNSFDFGNTARFYLRLPDGVGYSSTSGDFLTAAAPLLLVPEPATWSMFLAGVALVVANRRRRQAI